MRYAKRHPPLVDIPGITHTGSGMPGDPLNVVLIGTKNEVMKAMVDAGWHPAASLSFDSCLKIVAATVLKRPYVEAPVSNLYLFGRKQDLAFEFPVGNDPRKRHHVRFWKSDRDDTHDRPVWIDAATYDEKVGLSHRTGQVTHHIAADVDTERAHVFETSRIRIPSLGSMLRRGSTRSVRAVTAAVMPSTPMSICGSASSSRNDTARVPHVGARLRPRNW